MPRGYVAPISLSSRSNRRDSDEAPPPATHLIAYQSPATTHLPLLHTTLVLHSLPSRHPRTPLPGHLLLHDQDNNETVAYWLSNSSALLLLMQRTCLSSRGTMLMGIRAPPQISMFRENFNTQNIIEARYPVASYPALLFKQQLIAKLEKMYAMIRDNLKREVSAFLDLCIQAPKTFRASLISGASVANVLAQQALIGHWQSIVKILTNYLSVLKSNYVPSFLICKLFVQIFSYINVQLFNSLLLRRQCCSFINGEYVRAGLTELEKWIIDATEEYAGCSWDELKHIRQAVGFLVTVQEPMKTLIEITNDLCPVLSLQQRYRISSMLSDAKCGTLTVSSEVLSSMKTMIIENSENGASDFVILDDNICIPFSVDDILNCAPGFDIRNVDMPPLVLDHPCFSFLHETKDKLDSPALHVKMPPVVLFSFKCNVSKEIAVHTSSSCEPQRS